MAKVRRTHSSESAMLAVTKAVRLETDRIAGKDIDINEYQKAIHGAMDVFDDSNIRTAMENLDDSVELQHQIAADLDRQLVAEQIAERAATQEQVQEQKTEQGEQEQGTKEKIEQEQAQEQETKPVDEDDDIPY